MPSQNHPQNKRSEDTKNKITEAALALIMEKGADVLSISEVCRFAGVSRPTLYRHFKVLDDVIESVFLKVRTDFDEGLYKAIQAMPATEDRINVVTDYMAKHLVSGKTQKQFYANPQFTVELVDRFFDDRCSLYESVLEPVFTLLEKINDNKIDRQAVSEALNHYYISLNLHSIKQMPDISKLKLKKVLCSLLNLTYSTN